MNRINRIFQNVPAAVVLIFAVFHFFLAAPAHAEVESHADAYQQALAKIEAGQSKLLAEIGKIQSGEVAHFDFLQYEHIEILRHARALKFPPSDLDNEQRSSVIARADRVLIAAEALEWHIADFLRGHALLDSAISNTIDIAEIASNDADERTTSELQNLLSAARQFRTEPEADRLQLLSAAFDAIMTDAEFEEASWHEELAFQQKLIMVNVRISDNAKAALEASQLTAETKALAQLFR